jgi:hypothetical protein
VLLGLALLVLLLRHEDDAQAEHLCCQWPLRSTDEVTGPAAHAYHT